MKEIDETLNQTQNSPGGTLSQDLASSFVVAVLPPSYDGAVVGPPPFSGVVDGSLLSHSAQLNPSRVLLHVLFLGCFLKFSPKFFVRRRGRGH